MKLESFFKKQFSIKQYIIFTLISSYIIYLTIKYGADLISTIKESFIIQNSKTIPINSRYVTIINQNGGKTEILGLVVSGLGLLVSIFLGYVGIQFNKSSKFRTEMAFEEFRPHIIFKLNETNNIVFENIGTFEASNIQLYFGLSKGDDKNNIKFNLLNKYNQIILSPKIANIIEYPGENGYYTFLMFYTNLASGKYYIAAANYFFDDSLHNIGEDFFSQFSNKHYYSGINKDKYVELINSLKIENQIKNNVDTKSIINDFVAKILHC